MKKEEVKELLIDDLKELGELDGRDLIFLLAHRFFLYRAIIEKLLEEKDDK